MEELSERQWQDFLRDLLNEIYKYEDENIWFKIRLSGEDKALTVWTCPKQGYSAMISLDLQEYGSIREVFKIISSFAKWYQQEAANRKD